MLSPSSDILVFNSTNHFESYRQSRPKPAYEVRLIYETRTTVEFLDVVLVV